MSLILNLSHKGALQSESSSPYAISPVEIVERGLMSAQSNTASIRVKQTTTKSTCLVWQSELGSLQMLY